jgi:hypothetical protein
MNAETESAVSEKYYVLLDNEECGPFTAAELGERVRRGVFTEEMLCARPGDAEWRAVGEVRGLKRERSQQPGWMMTVGFPMLVMVVVLGAIVVGIKASRPKPPPATHQVVTFDTQWLTSDQGSGRERRFKGFRISGASEVKGYDGKRLEVFITKPEESVQHMLTNDWKATVSRQDVLAFERTSTNAPPVIGRTDELLFAR